MKFYTTAKISENMHETPEGYLVCIGVPIARTGDMTYAKGETPLEVDDDGKVIVTRDQKEVFRPETMTSFEGKPITILHPDDFVSPENWANLTKGTLQNVRRGKGVQENDLVADLLITDSIAIKLVKDGLREVSCGYEAEYTQTGFGRGSQSKIIGNHLALVQEGRAGSSYAINDHKGKGLQMTMGEKIKALFAKAQDEALKIAETKDDAVATEPEKKPSSASMDEIKKYFDEKFEGLKGEKKADDASTKPAAGVAAEVSADAEEKPKEEEKKAADVAPSMEERMAKLEALCAKLVAGESSDADACDAEEEEKGEMVGDTASRIEILAPGMKAEGKGAKVKALIAAYATTDGRNVINQFTGGKAPDLTDEKRVDAIFIAASEVLKVTRSQDLSKTKTQDFQSNLGLPVGAMTAEKMNELNAKHYAAH